MQDSQNHMENVVKYSRWGEWASTIAIGLFAVFLTVVAVSILRKHAFPIDDIIDNLDLHDAADTLTMAQAATGALFISAVDVLGILMLLTARRLFIGFRHAGVFTLQAAAQLRRIGLLILALAPVSILSQIIGNFVLTLWITGDNISINISLEDTDVYAIVIGLVITAVSQIMLEAVRISDENRAFI